LNQQKVRYLLSVAQKETNGKQFTELTVSQCRYSQEGET